MEIFCPPLACTNRENAKRRTRRTRRRIRQGRGMTSK
jgi:hypothetical protein